MNGEGLNHGFLQFMESAPDAMVCVDARGVIRLVNQQAADLFGWARDDLVGKTMETLVPQRYKERHVHHRDGYIAQPHVRPMGLGQELTALRKDGSEVPVEISLSPIESDDGRIVVASIRDVTRRREQERAAREAEEKEQQLQQLREQDVFRTQFINAAAHELFTPMTPIHATMAMLRRLGDDPVKREKAMDILERSIGRLAGLVKDLLEASRFQSGRLTIHREDADLVVVAHDVVEAFLASAEDKGIALDFQAPESAVASVDADRISQVVYNLVSNAIKFTPDAGHVEVLVDEHPDAVKIQVRDDGLGMDADQLQRLFQPFTRLHEGVAPGTGLGLYVSHGILEAHGGSLDASSDGPGKGTTFTLVVPKEAP